MAWVNSSVRSITWKNIYSVKEELVTAILLGLFLVLVATFSIRQQAPPLAASTTVSPDSFSAGRAVRHLPLIAERPRPIGSSEHGTVKNYLSVSCWPRGSSHKFNKRRSLSIRRNHQFKSGWSRMFSVV